MSAPVGVGGGTGLYAHRTVNGQPRTQADTEQQARDQRYSLKMSGDVFNALLCADQKACGDSKPLFLRVVLTDASPAVLEKLKQLGFNPAGGAANKVIYGELPASALKSLADLPQVFYISRAEPKDVKR